MNALYLTATGPLSGKTAATLGIMHMLSLSMRDVAIFRPIINTPQMTDRDPDIHLMLEQFKLRQDYVDTFVYTYEEARKVINRGDHDLVIETIIKQFKKLQAEHDFVLVEGTDFLGKDAVYEFELNAEIASNLGCPVVLVVNGEHSADDLRQSLQAVMATRARDAPASARRQQGSLSTRATRFMSRVWITRRSTPASGNRRFVPLPRITGRADSSRARLSSRMSCSPF